jgi:homoserine acetyltransferase
LTIKYFRHLLSNLRVLTGAIQGEEFCLKYDANSLLYISKAMDLFDLSLPALTSLSLKPPPPRSASSSTSSPDYPHSPTTSTSHSKSHPPPPHPPAHLPALVDGLSPLANTPILVLGVQSDILFTVEQQREVVDALRIGGNEQVRYYELGGVWGHDTFLLDVINVGGAIRGFLS